MTLGEIAAQVGLALQTDNVDLSRSVTGGYASDMLSCVMAKAREGNIWVTLQAHPNIVAVASLLNLAGIVVTEGVMPDEETLQKAVQERVAIFTTPRTTFTVVGQLSQLGIRGTDQGAQTDPAGS